ncbi:hypothetical protein ACQKOF_05295 [Lysinibacillus sp. NPDC093190]|uniref:hypothetical protein n=1 Tax=Lysinibacillus sp. NPDC093190 TaxID=3390575 RepID=UPI003D06CECC
MKIEMSRRNELYFCLNTVSTVALLHIFQQREGVILVDASSVHKITFILGNDELIDNQKYEMTLSLSLNAFDYGIYKLREFINTGNIS